MNDLYTVSSYPVSLPTSAVEGSVWYDHSTNELYTFKSNTWYRIEQADTSSNEPYITNADLDWIYRKQEEERKFAELCERYPDLAEAKREWDTAVAFYTLAEAK